MLPKRRPVALVVLDGWGISNAPSPVTEARLPFFHKLLETCPNTVLKASGEAVGLMPGQMGDSNVGHLNIGAGRIVYQDLVRISRDIENGSFFENPALVGAVEHAKKNSSYLHLMGLLSDGGVHSMENHLWALLELCRRRGLQRVMIHAFLDGRDVPPRSAEIYFDRLEKKIQEIGVGYIASMVGRYYAMDRDKRWDRVEKAWRLLTRGEGIQASRWREGLAMAYERGESDEFVSPTVLGPSSARKPIGQGDAVIFFNFRADRARELTHAFIDDEFEYFERGPRPDVYFCGMLRYEEGIEGHYAYAPLVLVNTLGEVVSRAGLRQLRIAETEKYAHVTFFLNGKKDDPFPGEDRCLIPSPRGVATYDQKPEMSAPEVTQAAVDRVKSGVYDLVVLNYANPDMVGHTGVFSAGVKALETVDQCLEVFVEAVLEQGGACLIIADHGNIEDLAPSDDPQGKACAGTQAGHTYHSCNPVPCILVGYGRDFELRPGILADVAPTILEMLGLEKPAEMEGTSLIVKPENASKEP